MMNVILHISSSSKFLILRQDQIHAVCQKNYSMRKMVIRLFYLIKLEQVQDLPLHVWNFQSTSLQFPVLCNLVQEVQFYACLSLNDKEPSFTLTWLIIKLLS